MARSTTVVTVKDRAYHEATHAVLDLPEMQNALDNVRALLREDILALVGTAVGVAIRSAWDTAHQEGHGCKSPFCKAKG
jgi:hypothetical protein